MKNKFALRAAVVVLALIFVVATIAKFRYKDKEVTDNKVVEKTPLSFSVSTIHEQAGTAAFEITFVIDGKEQTEPVYAADYEIQKDYGTDFSKFYEMIKKASPRDFSLQTQLGFAYQAKYKNTIIWADNSH